MGESKGKYRRTMGRGEKKRGKNTPVRETRTGLKKVKNSFRYHRK